MLSRDELIKPKTKEVTLSAGVIRIRALTAGEAFEYRGKDLGAAEIFGMLATSIIDPVLTVADVQALPVALVNEIVNEVLAFNALGERAAAEAVAELKKTQAPASTSN